MPLERRLHDAPLDTDAAPMNEPDLAQARGVRGVHEFLHHGRNVARRERVQIQLGFDRDAVHSYLGVCSATTVVLMPPRTVKAPVTVMRRGWHAATRSSRIRLVTAS